jgi:hypothetical protein
MMDEAAQDSDLIVTGQERDSNFERLEEEMLCECKC